MPVALQSTAGVDAMTAFAIDLGKGSTQVYSVTETHRGDL